MNYTEKYHLPQWVKEDRIMMGDFNDAMANIDEGMAGIAQAAEEGIANTASTAAAAAQSAQTAANTALANAAKAQAKADAAYAPDQPPYAVGTYTGTGAAQTITLGFRPRFVIVCGPESLNYFQYSMMAGEGASMEALKLTSSGFVVGRNTLNVDKMETWPRIVEYGKVYHYIAFR